MEPFTAGYAPFEGDDNTPLRPDSPALAAQYAPLVTTLDLPARSFGAASGGPADGASPANRASGWAFDASNIERVWRLVAIPSHWTTATATVIWTNGGAGAGDVVWSVYYGSGAEDVDVSTLPPSASVTDTAGTAGVIKYATTAAFSVPNSGGLNAVAVHRSATNGADTLANDAVFYSLILTRAS